MKPIPLRKLKEQTEVVEKCPVTVCPSTWLVWGAASPLYFNGEVIGFWNSSPSDCPVMCSDSLPVEFFNHEIMDYDNSGDTVKSAAAFLENYGVPTLPASRANRDFEEREKEFYRYLLAGAIELPAEAAAIEAMRLGMVGRYDKDETTLYRRITDDDGIRLFDDSYIRTFKRSMEDRAVPLLAVDYPLKQVKAAFGSILAGIDAHIEKPNAQGFYDSFMLPPTHAEVMVNDYARPHRFIFGQGGIEVFLNGQNNAGLVSAVCTQFIEAMDDPTPWRRCKKCGRLFKYQINERRRQAAKKVNGGKGHEDAAYCCKKCADAGRQSAYRAGIRTKSGF